MWSEFWFTWAEGTSCLIRMSTGTPTTRIVDSTIRITSSLDRWGGYRTSRSAEHRSATTFGFDPPSIAPMFTVISSRKFFGRVYGSNAARTLIIFRIALSPRWGIEPWALLPWVVTSNQRIPFSLPMIARSEGSPTTTAAAFFTRPVPWRVIAARIVVSSSVVKRTENGTSLRFSSRAAASIAAHPAFMSAVPRPYRSGPSRSSGFLVHACPTGTVSRWPLNRTPPWPWCAYTARSSEFTAGSRPNADNSPGAPPRIARMSAPGPPPVGDLGEPSAGGEPAGGCLPLHAGPGGEGFGDEPRVRTEVRAEGLQAGALKADRSRRVRGAQENQGGLRVPPQVVGDEEGR